MKKLIVVAVAVVVLMTILAVAQQPWQPQKELRDQLIQPPDILYRQYGYSDDTLVLYNIWANQAACKNHEIRMTKMQEQIAELEKQLAELADKIKIKESAVLPMGKEVRAAPAGKSDPAGAGPADPPEVTEKEPTANGQ